MCGSLASSPRLRQRRVAINHEFTTGMAGIINQFTQQQHEALEEQKVMYHKYIKRLKRDLVEECTLVAQQTSQIDDQAKEIEDLQISKQEMMKQLKDIEAKLRTSEDRARRLEEKYHTCKTHLNSASKSSRTSTPARRSTGRRQSSKYGQWRGFKPLRYR
jgi:chromosome segregation ATPase